MYNSEPRKIIPYLECVVISKVDFVSQKLSKLNLHLELSGILTREIHVGHA